MSKKELIDLLKVSNKYQKHYQYHHQDLNLNQPSPLRKLKHSDLDLKRDYPKVDVLFYLNQLKVTNKLDAQSHQLQDLSRKQYQIL